MTLASIERFIAADDQEAADRVLAAIDHTFDLIQQRPLWFGTTYSDPTLPDLRRASVSRYRQYQIFYLALPDETRVLYVRRGGGAPWETIFQREGRK